MESLLLYNLKVAACMAVFYLFYKLLLSRETFHRLNRILLLCAFAASFLLPVCVITVEREMVMVEEPVVVQPMTYFEAPEVSGVEYVYDEAETEVASVVPEEPFPWVSVGVGLFISGGLLALLWTLWSLVCTMRIIRRGRIEPLGDGLMLSRHDKVCAPFSWGRWIVISEADYAESGADILAHERAHIRCRHSWDLLVTDLMCCLQWFNPAMWLLRAELRALHEYEADAAVLEAGADAKRYQLLLVKKAVGGRWYSVANSLNHSNLKSRITMMLRKRSSRWAGARVLFVLPLLCIALGAFARTTYVVPEDEITENFSRPQGFTGAMTVRQDDEGSLFIATEGKGDAMVGVGGLFEATVFPYMEQGYQTLDTLKAREYVQIAVALSPDSAARAQRFPRPLLTVDGEVVAPETVLLIRPSHILNENIVEGRDEIARYGVDPDVYGVVYQITTKHGVKAATAGVKAPKKRVVQPSAAPIVEVPKNSVVQMSAAQAPKKSVVLMSAAPIVEVPKNSVVQMSAAQLDAKDKPSVFAPWDPTRMEMVLPNGQKATVSTLGMLIKVKKSVDADFSKVPGALFLINGHISSHEEAEKILAEKDRGKIFLTIVKSREVVDKYGPAAESGVVVISTESSAVVKSFINDHTPTYGISTGLGKCRVERRKTKSGKLVNLVLEGVYQVYPETLPDGLYFIDGSEAHKESITADRWIKQIEVRKYGEKAEECVVYVSTAKPIAYIGATTIPKADGNMYVKDTGFGFRIDPGDFTPLVVVDGQVVQSSYIHKMDPQKIKWVRPVYGPVSTEKYGEAARDCNCLLLIKTKA